jgi:hypothetical protein
MSIGLGQSKIQFAAWHSTPIHWDEIAPLATVWEADLSPFLTIYETVVIIKSRPKTAILIRPSLSSESFQVGEAY